MKKKIGQQNWLEPDDIMKGYGKISLATGVEELTAGQDWLNVFIGPKLDYSVPLEVQALFEGARGALVYGYFYYPLFYLGLTELPRVAEAAAHHKCKVEGKSAQPRKKYDDFNDNINWLVENGYIQQADADWWTLIRHARNFASHPTDAGLITPAMALIALERTAEKINVLFPAQSS